MDGLQLFGTGLPGPQQGLLSLPAGAPHPTGWLDALAGISAALKDAGAGLMHQPQAADNVANWLAQRLLPVAGAATPAMANGVPPALAALMLRQQLHALSRLPAAVTPPSAEQ